MSTAHERYQGLVDVLREARRAPTWAAPEDREILGALEDLFDRLTPDEQGRVNDEGWRGWPDLYDDHVEAHPMLELTPDLDDLGSLGVPPREWQDAA
jgi:hypothetical protein